MESKKYYVSVHFSYSKLNKMAMATAIYCGFNDGSGNNHYELLVSNTPSHIFNCLVEAIIDEDYSKVRHILKDDLSFNSDAYELELEKYI